MGVIAHCALCGLAIEGKPVNDSDGERAFHQACFGMVMEEERDDARQQLRGAVSDLERVRAVFCLAANSRGMLCNLPPGHDPPEHYYVGGQS